MKVKFNINGQIYEKDIDPNEPVNINLVSNSGDDSENQQRSQDPHREVVHFTKSTNAFGTSFDEIERTIIRDDNGEVVDVIDRNLSEEFRKEQRELNKIKKQAEYREVMESWKARPWYEKGIIYILWSSPIWVYILCRILLAK